MADIQRALSATYDVVHNPCNAMSSTWTRQQIDYWLGSRVSFEAITWNNGLWDTVDTDPTSDATYDANLHAIAAKIKSKTAHPLFVLTTEVLPGTPNQSNADVIQKNMIAVAVMAAEGIPVLDLYKISQGLVHASPTDLHYTPAGSAALGAAVVAELTTRYGIIAKPIQGADK
jgi:lysophospholipase L1-like esterase